MRFPISPTLFLSLVCSIGACTLYEGTPPDGVETYDETDAGGYWPPDQPEDGGQGYITDAGFDWSTDAGFDWSADAGLVWSEDAGPVWSEDAGAGGGCEIIFQEAICVVTAGCQPQYNGVNCSCDMISCRCDAFEFQSCQ